MQIKRCCLCLFAFMALLPATAAELPFVSPMFSDNMVLQRGKPNPIWGWVKPGEVVKVEIAGHTAKAVADADGRWQAEIQPPAPGGHYTIKIVGPDRTVEFHEVLVGDVWLCGGQSNMELGIGLVNNAAEEIASANHPEIRLFLLNHKVSYSPASVPDGTWKICSPQTITEGGWQGFSAVAYFFGRRVQQDIHVPVGLIEDCWGGTPVESWTSPAVLHKVGGYDPKLAEIERLSTKPGPQYGSFLMHWLDEYDMGISNKWEAADMNDSPWQTVQIPGAFGEMGLADVPCICWFRKEVTLPNPLPTGKATIYLGSIEKMDTTYINGHWVGESSWVENPRAYDITGGILKPGTNLVVIRVFKWESKNGFLSGPDVMRLELGDKTAIPLAGDWKGKLSCNAKPPHPMPLDFENYPTMPAVLNLEMIDPVAPLAIKGAIWYQGEANFTQAYRYRTLLPAMIGDWRNLFGQGDFPFYIVSLPAFMQRRSEPGTDGWTELREAQALTAQNVPHCGLAVTVDTGDADNIHPKNKVPVGERLAYCALAETYGEKIPYQGPTFTSMKPLPGALKLNLTHTDGGLVVQGDKLGEFSVAGKDRQWHWATARIDGDAVVVSSPEVPDPVAARYAWQANPLATLYNGAGLPAVPFRTDDWPESTGN
ncbi:MAG TPA: sialate O-acetylesterase [Verrucomicrobiae bacterium]|nr:sialate O-acetylesterase [Verrucomicrobiae bacterium]